MDKARADLAIYRLETARQCIISAKALIEISDYKGAANRSYYAVFHCMRSIRYRLFKTFCGGSLFSQTIYKNGGI